MSNIQSKRPDEVLDYVFDFLRWLPSGDVIASASATIASSTGGTAAVDSVTNDTNTATVWVSAGIEDENAEITVRIVTAAGRHKDACMKLRIKDCC
jgi:hypothetical protein